MHLAELSGLPDGEESQDTTARVGGGGKILADIKVQKTEWLWENYMPRGKVTMIYGERGSRKSTLSADLASRVSMGSLMPDGSQGIRGGVILVSAEEDTAETVKPRLDCFGADQSRISILSDVEREAQEYGDIIESPFKLPEDLGILQAEIKRINAILVILDPLHGIASGKISIYRDQSAMEKFLVPLQVLARNTGAAVVIVGHFVKGNKKNLLDAAGGSGGIVNFVRVVHAVLQDPANADRSLFLNIKNNLVPMQRSLAFRRKLDSPVEWVHGEKPSYAQSQVAQKLSLARQNILALLSREAPRTMNSSEISNALELENPNVRYHLSDMCKLGMITSPSRGMYAAIEQKSSQNSNVSQGTQQTQELVSSNGHAAAVL